MELFHTARRGIALRSARQAPRRHPGALRMAAAVLLLVIGLLLYGKPAAAQLLKYDPQLAQQRQEVVHTVILTRACMFEATNAMLLQGERRAEALEAFAVATCGSRMRAFLLAYAKWDRRDADALIAAFAKAEVQSSLSWGR